MDFDNLLSQLEAQRPDLSDSLSLIRKFHQNKPEEKDNSVEVQTETEVIKELEKLLEKQKLINKNLLKQYEKLEDHYGTLVSQLDEIAGATGACPHCWGQDTGCNYCRGRGRPGYYFPDQGFFDTYVKPVILKIKKQ